ncbi:Adenylate kinase domain-containing protein 1, partial [Ophiophagus hannah]
MASPEDEQPYPFVDIYNEDEADRAFLLSKPTCFVILGKPGVGKKTLAKKIAQFWKCTLVDAFELINENVTAETEYGLKCKDLLYQGQNVPEELVIKMLMIKLDSPEINHFGYVLCDFPSLSEDFMSTPEQIDVIKNLKLKPDFLINIKCPNNDLCQRITGQRQQPDTGHIFKREDWDPDIIEKRKKKKKELHKGEEEDEEAEEEEEEEESNEADQIMLTEILPTLVQRPEDFKENAQKRIDLYKDILLRPLEELMAEQDSQYLFELDGNKNADELFKSVITRLESMGQRYGALITKLQSADEEMLDGVENDELFRVLASYKLVGPRHRWRRSKWGQACPVALKDGKMYLLSTEEALKQFMLNPRSYLLPPMPLPPCKVLVVGPPFSGKTTLCELLANHYQGKVDISSVPTESEIPLDHPDIQEVVQSALEAAMLSPITLPPETYVDVLEETIEELQKTNSSRYPGAACKGGWVVDNFPPLIEHWIALSEKGLLPDIVICLKNVEQNGQLILHRLYKAHKEEIDVQIIQRLIDDALKKKQEEEEAKQYPEGGFPDVVEIEPFKNKLTQFQSNWQKLESHVAESPVVQITELEIDGQTPEKLLSKSVQAMQQTFKYHGWELSPEDDDEEQEDLQAEAEAQAEEEEGDEEEEEEEEEDEEKIAERKRHMGDTKHFCPVILKENFILYPGNSENAAKYREKYYYFSTPENRDKFLENPEEYVSHNEPLKAPPIRICLLGPHGTGKTACARWLADKLNIFHIQFEEHLQELVMVKTGKRVGPEEEEEEEEGEGTQELGESTIPESAPEFEFESEEESKHIQEKDVLLTDEEEAIKANILENEPIPMEVLDNIVLDWWMKEPFRSTGFILDGFPRIGEEVQYLGERSLFPDIVVCLEAEEDDISDRLLMKQVLKWKEKQAKKMEKKKQIKEMKTKEEQIARRRVELLTEQTRRKLENEAKKLEDEDEEDEEEEEDIEAILEDEFPKEEEEEEEEEQETEAIERLKTEIAERYETDTGNMQTMQEELEKLLIPIINLPCKRKPHIVRYQLFKKIKDLVENRESIFEKCYPLSFLLARKMIVLSYKHPSNFGQWDPIKLSEGDAIKPFRNDDTPCFPVIHRNCIYFFTSKENREKFMKNPLKYLRQPKPKPTVPVKIAIVGPSKSGKTTVAKKFAETYGLLRLSMGDAIRSILNNQPETELALVLKWHLHKGLTAPDELALRALDIALMDTVCNTSGVVLDGYPVTRKQVDILEEMKIIPIKIFELDIDIKEVLRRALLDKQSPNRPPYPLHDSSHIISLKNSCYRAQTDEIRPFYEEQHQNWYVLDGSHSKWWIWNKILLETQAVTKQIQLYLERIRQGKAACIADMCITPNELFSRLGEFGQYCPVSLAEREELIDCSDSPSLKFAAEFRGHYYKMAGQKELDKFLKTPELYVPPLAPYPLPLLNNLPKRLTVADVKALFPMQAELQGFCPVTYLDGKRRYEALVPGNIEYAVLYRKKLYIFENEEKLQRFMRKPEKYWNLTLPHKLPPLKEPIVLTALPLTGYLEQGVATALIKAMNAVGCLKPKFPYLSVKRTALLFIAYHLKAYNPNTPNYIRKKYKMKLERFIDHCELIPYLGIKMTKKYKEPQNRPIDFDHKLQIFLSLKDVDPLG